MEKYYELKIAGLTRQLEICPISDTLAIAAFVPFSDVELTQRCIAELLTKVPAFDIVLTAECKGITFAYEMSVQSGIPYVLARKQKKAYMKQPVCLPLTSITTQGGQQLYLDQSDMDKLAGKRVLLLDDVVSTGSSLHALEQIARQSGGVIAAQAAILAEGEAKNRTDLIYLAYLPLLPLAP